MKVVGVHHGLGCDQKEMCKSLCCDQVPRCTYASYVLFFNFDRIFYIYTIIFCTFIISIMHYNYISLPGLPAYIFHSALYHPNKQSITTLDSRLLIVGIKDIHTSILNTSSCHTITEEHKIIDISTYLGIFFTIQLNFYLKFFFLVLKYQPFIVIF